MSNAPEDKKIIIDEDWKSQVQSEKEAVEAARQDPEQAEAAAEGAAGQMPPADFRTLVSMLATQAMVSLGVIPNPMTGQPEVFLDQAKHFIDLINVLQEKTAGNLSEEETQMMEGLTHELRMAFVARGAAPEDMPTTEPPAEG